MAHHQDVIVRRAVAYGLLRHEAPEAVAVLIELSRDADDEVRDWATFGLGSQVEADTPTVRQALWERVGDEHYDTREEALLGLALRRDTRVLDPLLEVLAGDEVGRLAVEAAEALGDGALLAVLKELRQWWTLDSELLERAIASCSSS